MPKLDSFEKQLFVDETPGATQGALSFEASKTTHFHSAELDGLLFLSHPIPKKGQQKARAQLVAKLAHLPYPWPLFTPPEVVVELKMKGDHTDREAVMGAFFRHHAYELHLYVTKKFTAPVPLWVVAARVPKWVEASTKVTRVKKGVLGCYRVEMLFFPCYWVSSNELPLHEELIPFLATRDGKPLEEFVRWVADKREPGWVKLLMKVVRMRDSFVQEMLKKLPPTTDPQLKKQELLIARDYVEKNPVIKDELLEAGEARGEVRLLKELLAKKLKRALSPAEEKVFEQKLSAQGKGFVEELIVEKSLAEVSAWLSPATAKTPAKKTGAKK